MKTRQLTKDDLSLAQALHHALDSLHDHADRIDPERKRQDLIASCLDSSRASMSQAFLYLTTRHYSQVHICELSTEHPAAWTKNVEIW